MGRMNKKKKNYWSKVTLIMVIFGSEITKMG